MHVDFAEYGRISPFRVLIQKATAIQPCLGELNQVSRAVDPFELTNKIHYQLDSVVACS